MCLGKGSVCEAGAWRGSAAVVMMSDPPGCGPHGLTFGEVSERLKELVSKTSVGVSPTVGSNPTLSALFR